MASTSAGGIHPHGSEGHSATTLAAAAAGGICSAAAAGTFSSRASRLAQAHSAARANSISRRICVPAPPDGFAPGQCADKPDGTCTNLGMASSNDPAPITVGFDRYGFRVPSAVISPWVKPGYVSHQVHDHTSILKFIETRFGLGALTHRDANADDMLDYFDFDQDPSSAKLFDASSVLQTLPVPAFDPLRALMCLENGPSTSDELPSP